MHCTCPDWASMCKHVAATLYGVGARLDSAPEMLFTLRNVDHLELINQAVAADNLDRSLATPEAGGLAGADLSEMFGIELDAVQSAGGAGRKQKAAARRVEPAVDAPAKPKRSRGKLRLAAAKKSSPPKARRRRVTPR